MKDDNIEKFLKEHKQTIENDGFNERLFSHLDGLPTPAPRVDRTRMIISMFSVLGLVFFIALGGHNALISGLSSMGTLFGSTSLIKPEVVVPVVLMVCSLFLLGKYAIQER